MRAQGTFYRQTAAGQLQYESQAEFVKIRAVILDTGGFPHVAGSPDNMVLFWVLFNLMVLGLLAFDLGVFHRRAHSVKMKEALGWVGFWVSLALVFNVVIYFWHGKDAALEFLAGYLIEYSLSIDNIFVFILILSYFQVKPKYQHTVLFWGIIGALILRATLILTGIALVEAFHWVIYIFGAILIISGAKMAVQKDESIDPAKNPILRFIHRVLPVSKHYQEGKFFVRESGRLLATPLLVVLIFVEITDLIFALDSIPAIIAITRDPFIVYTSNIFAILGLRSLYFALAGMMGMFRFLKYGLSAILIFVGVKMCISHWFHFSIQASLGVIVAVLALSVIMSLLFKKKKAEAGAGEDGKAVAGGK